MGISSYILKMKFFALIGLTAAVNLEHKFFTPFQKGMLGEKEYKRVIPAQFTGDGDDIFIRSVLTSYALEGSDAKGNPTGVFFLDETQAKALASEALCTHKSLCGGKLAEYLGTGLKPGDISMSTSVALLNTSRPQVS